MSKPRHDCRAYFVETGLKPVQITPMEFDFYAGKGLFRDGPFHPGDHYTTNRQAFGVLCDGTGVYCTLNQQTEDTT